MKIAIIGVTGLVGQTMLKILYERQFPVDELIAVASERSVGKTIQFKQKAITIVSMEEAIAQSPDIVLFSAGGSVSRQYAPRFAEKGSYVIDNSSAWRMENDVPLVVPEVNAKALSVQNRIIANPNCSTIQLVVALAPLHAVFGIHRIVISTYQSITGTGQSAVNQLIAEENKEKSSNIYPHAIHRNCLPHCDIFGENDYSREEMKLIRETRKIFAKPAMHLTATAVRVPVVGGHSESVNVEFKTDFDILQVRQILEKADGILVEDAPHENIYPMPITANNRDEVFVGRIRRDESQANTLNMWIVADNLRKGAATNAVQIAEYLIKNGFVN